MKFINFSFFSILLFSLSSFVHASSYYDDDDDRYSSSECTDTVINRVDSETLVDNGGSGFGNVTINGLEYKSSELTTCIQKRNRVKAVVAWNTNGIHVKTGSGQQVVNARNLMNDWESSYQMEIGEDYKVAIVVYGAGANWVLNDTTANPAHAMVSGLLARGANIYMCQNTMKSKKWTADKLIPGVKMVTSGVTALVDFQAQGMIYISP